MKNTKQIKDEVVPFEKRLPKKIVRLLREVQQFILDNPKQFNMNSWAQPSGNMCGTVGCICGHMALRDTPKREVADSVNEVLEYRALMEDGQVFLGCRRNPHSLIDLVVNWRNKNLPLTEWPEFDNLFYPENWSEQFLTRSGNVTPKLAAKRIDYFLLHGE